MTVSAHHPVFRVLGCPCRQADICQLGMDQRKVNMLAREYCDMLKPKRKFKPVILSHRMLCVDVCVCLCVGVCLCVWCRLLTVEALSGVGRRHVLPAW